MNALAVEILVPREDVNDNTATLVRWLVEEGQEVERGQPIALLETSKTVFEVVAPEAGLLRHRAAADQEVKVGAVLAVIGTAEGEDPPHGSPLDSGTPTRTDQPPEAPPALLTRAARALAPTTLPAGRGWISARDLKPASRRPTVYRGAGSRALKRVLLLGGGSVGLQALDILMHDPMVQVVGLLDDHPQAHERDFFGYPLAGKMADLGALYRDGAFDEALVTVGVNLKVRRQLFERCRELDIPMANAIDPSARLNRQATFGQGNILCSFVHLGVLASLGDNNFVAAHSSLDHHNRIGDHNLFGPGCLLSGTVTVGDGCLFGSGVVVQPGLSIGDECQIASGTVILKDVPDRHAVRLRLSQTQEPLS